MVLLLVFMQLTRDLFAIAKFLFIIMITRSVLYCLKCTRNRLAAGLAYRPDLLGELERSPRPY